MRIFIIPSLNLDVANIISLSNDWCNQLMKENEAYPKLCNKPSLTLDNLAYAVYSSGTTGKPKGNILTIF